MPVEMVLPVELDLRKSGRSFLLLVEDWCRWWDWIEEEGEEVLQNMCVR
jgi:hypothetical protein